MPKTIEKKINNSYILWFEQSNRWIQLEEPAWFVNKLHQKGIDSHTISLKCARKYHLSQKECLSFVDEICKEIAELSKPSVSKVDVNFLHLPGNDFVPYSTRYYLIGAQCFAIIFETRLAEYFIHQPLAHLETKHCGDADVQYEIFKRSNVLVLMEKNHPETATSFEDFNQLKKRLFINMTNAIYHKTNSDWMSFVHASALTDGNHTVLLSSASGSGKSTMAALLQTKGLQLVADDFVPIDAKNKRAFPFPTGISVKEGAFTILSQHYRDLQNINFNGYEYADSSVRYLSPQSSELTYFNARPVKTIVFIHYNPQLSCKFKSIPTNKALKIFHEHAWVSGNPNHARAFINWFVKLSCYNLEYGDTQKGINKILGIFKC
jgi:hypothetical protein